MSQMAKKKDLVNGNCPKRQTFLQAKASCINKNPNDKRFWQMSKMANGSAGKIILDK